VNLEEYHTLFMVTTLTLSLVAATPTLIMVVPISKTEKPFSELWILGPNHMAENYPLNISIGEQKLLFIGVANHMHSSMYYIVYAKFRNQTQPLPDDKNSTPSPVLPLYEFRFFLVDGENWETPLNFTILDASLNDNNLVVKRISINDMIFEGEYVARRDLGLVYQIFFELWLYNMTSGKSQYHNRFVSNWLKVTG